MDWNKFLFGFDFHFHKKHYTNSMQTKLTSFYLKFILLIKIIKIL